MAVKTKSRHITSDDEILIGLEIHVQLTVLNTKLFCGCSTNYRGKAPNKFLCPICLGLPGSLPVVNGKAIEFAIMVGLALDCEIPPLTLFHRKNYFYPDMPKNFQISQYNKAGGVPIGLGGKVIFEMNHKKKSINLIRIQLEEDPGRLTYLGSIMTSPYTLVDYNRAGITLLEIVTTPELYSPEEARLFLQKVRSILEHLGVADCSLEGSMRCDANISIKGGNRVEIKNIGSFKAVQKALQFELIRQRRQRIDGVETMMETRHWDDEKGITISLRTKEEEHDYRYFPEPDLVPIELTPELIEELQQKMPELPDARKERFIKDYQIPEYDASVLTSSKGIADFFEECIKLFPDPKNISNWIMSDLLRHLNELNIEINESTVTPEQLVTMLKYIDEGTISRRSAKKVLWDMIRDKKTPDEIISEDGHHRIGDKEKIEKIIKKILKENPKTVEDAIQDDGAINFLVGQVMKETQGTADPQITYKILKDSIEKLRKNANIQS
ncbi:MAG TPA: Asp-tRNA(Asn)/Glu-tRNA(Gln) amidotransferase subunit GatB [Candidatus Deferrimicrobium sp.]|nr:Asp-tRNA(Asn)/Glu-tRNA(Gln) amidotransferase subunit GatB [Candidatus Deferrimicrobium sp.]